MGAPVLTRLLLIVLPVLVACMAAPARAQESSTYLHELRGADIPMAEAQFLLYQYLAGSGEGEMDAVLQDQLWARLDIGNARFFALIDHMREAVAASRDLADSEARELCARREDLKTVKDLGAALNKSMADLRAHQAELVADAKPILGPAGETRFAALVAEYRQRLVVNRVDYTVLLADSDTDAASVLDEICRQAGQEGRVE